MENRMVKTEMKSMRRRSDGKESGMCQWHARVVEVGKSKENNGKRHVAAAALLLLYTHDSRRDAWADFLPL
jgi:hypothetical protein